MVLEEFEFKVSIQNDNANENQTNTVIYSVRIRRLTCRNKRIQSRMLPHLQNKLYNWIMEHR